MADNSPHSFIDLEREGIERRGVGSAVPGSRFRSWGTHGETPELSPNRPQRSGNQTGNRWPSLPWVSPEGVSDLKRKKSSEKTPTNRSNDVVIHPIRCH